MPNKASTSAPPVGAVIHALAMLRLLAAEPSPLGVTAIARRLGLSPSSCFNIARTLVAEDMIAFDPVTKAYRIGLGAVDLARIALARDAGVQAALALMQPLAEANEAAVGLWRVGRRDRLTLIALAESESATRIHMAIGQRQPAGAGASGRALLAATGHDQPRIASAFAQVRWPVAVDFSQYEAQVALARQRGFATDLGQLNPGIDTVAAACPQPDGDVRFVVSASMFSNRHSDAALDTIGAALIAIAARAARS